MTTRFFIGRAAAAMLAAVLLSGNALAQSENPSATGSRWDISLDLPVWPSLGDLQPAAGGSFDAMGFGLGLSYHVPVAHFDNSDLLFGVDASVAATDSSINGVFDSMLARQLYLGGSLKWLLGERRNYSLDAGLGYHEVDIAEVDSEWWGTREYEHWSAEKASVFVGTTWDVGAGRPDHDGGLFIGLRVHFADFGRVADENFLSGLGPDAGALDGPLYMLRFGYSGR
ncbi:MAG: hypothetical protein OER91_01140 [Gammaproteobacteria bacterium]|nr:hypothetical protein [Gammaproteobacteria bacterium]